MGRLRNTDSEFVLTEPSSRTTMVSQRYPVKARKVHINSVTDSDQLPRSRHRNPENQSK